MFVNTTITTILCIQASNLWYFIKSSRAEEASFYLIIPGKPSPLTGCQIINRTLHSLKVECHEGEKGEADWNISSGGNENWNVFQDLMEVFQPTFS